MSGALPPICDPAAGMRIVRRESLDSGRAHHDSSNRSPKNCLSARSSHLVMPVVALLVSLFAGCASVRPGTGPAASTSAPKAKPVAGELMPGGQIDYAGHRCGNPNLYVKTHPCLFPQRNVAR
ncbi:hypothetical protein [Burkholderia sp. 567]|uniref:hypothetical protein n=1 Tax=Burkholderia sp. 567 TaxID=3156413 RepID=UPI003397D875